MTSKAGSRGAELALCSWITSSCYLGNMEIETKHLLGGTPNVPEFPYQVEAATEAFV